ncbi:MAG TPA: hypothetical protein VF784_02395, partial [Anaerolineales bacterium]
SLRSLDVMSSRFNRWLIDLSLVVVAAFLFLPIYIRDGQYGHAHAEASRVLGEARTLAGTNDVRYSDIIAGYRRGHESPEFYYRKRDGWGRAALGFFIIPAVAGLACRRWAAAVVVLILWVWSFSLVGVRY